MYEVQFLNTVREFDGTLEVGSIDPAAPFVLLDPDDAPTYRSTDYRDIEAAVFRVMGHEYVKEEQSYGTEYFATDEIIDPETGRVGTLGAFVTVTSRAPH